MRAPLLLALLLTAGAASGCNKDGDADDTGSSSPPQDTYDPSLDLDQDEDGYTPNQGDCNDHDPSLSPAAPEVACDGIDQNCDGADLDDIDGDGHACMEAGGDDCDDFDPTVNPSAEDPCGDLVDQDCDGALECDCDGDTYDGAQCDGDDCDDGAPETWPWAPDVCYDGVDSDCNGVDDYDCDGDGHASEDYGGRDCDDSDHSIYPGAGEICQDGVDNDCSDVTADCDCDADGHDAVECGGDDCDDGDDDRYPGASEEYADALDNDCDEVVDEDAYCNLYAPMSNGSSASKTYDVVYDGSAVTESFTPVSWDPATGEGVVERAWTGDLVYDITEYWTCDGDASVSMTGWDLDLAGLPFFALTFDAARVDLLAEGSLIEGESWTYGYAATDPTLGTAWEVRGVFTVEGSEAVEVVAGLFEAVRIRNDYELTDVAYGGALSRAGTVTAWYVERLGLVLSEDYAETEGGGLPGGGGGGAALFESRELTRYTDFYP